jgi:hypothetical protein
LLLFSISRAYQEGFLLMRSLYSSSMPVSCQTLTPQCNIMSSGCTDLRHLEEYCQNLQLSRFNRRPAY